MKALITEPISASAIEMLARHVEVDVRLEESRAALLEAVGDYTALVVRSQTQVDAELLDAADGLRVVARAGIGLDNVDVDEASRRGVLVCNAPESNVISAAEHTLALLLALARQIPRADRSMRAGEWNRTAFQGVELQGKTLGILGLGRVGTLVAQRAHAFGMHLLAHDPYVTTDRATALGVDLVDSVAELCAAVDVLTVHLPKLPETTGIVGAAELRGMKPTARVVNTARGGIIAEDALRDALTEGWIAGAALDVFDREPVVDPALLELDNVVVTPHLGASTAEAQDKAGLMAVEAVIAGLAGEFVPTAVNLRIGADVPQSVRPFLPLAERLGRLLTALHGGRMGTLTVECIGAIATEAPQALSLSALGGAVAATVAEPVTLVNAPLIAADRGVEVITRSTTSSPDFVSLLRLSVDDTTVAGTIIAGRNQHRLVQVWGFDIDMQLADHMVFFRYLDRPGIIGRIGERLAESGTNIAAMQVGRHEAGGDQVIAMAIDSAIGDDVLTDIAARIDAHEVRAVDLR